ncbi:XAC0095 family protein [Luteimonas endophytica]|uniref:XAC0095 family protein n=1 Tax=Luteimonas endophytica TaxID=3042023 RepID=UPI003CE5447A
MGYLLSEDAHLALLQVRDKLRFLALLAGPRGHDAPGPSLRPGALAECFWRVAGQLDGWPRPRCGPGRAPSPRSSGKPGSGGHGRPGRSRRARQRSLPWRACFPKTSHG